MVFIFCVSLNTMLFQFVFVTHTAPFVVENISNGLWFRKAKFLCELKIKLPYYCMALFFPL